MVEKEVVIPLAFLMILKLSSSSSIHLDVPFFKQSVTGGTNELKSLYNVDRKKLNHKNYVPNECLKELATLEWLRRDFGPQ